MANRRASCARQLRDRADRAAVRSGGYILERRDLRGGHAGCCGNARGGNRARHTLWYRQQSYDVGRSARAQDKAVDSARRTRARCDIKRYRREKTKPHDIQIRAEPLRHDRRAGMVLRRQSAGGCRGLFRRRHLSGVVRQQHRMPLPRQGARDRSELRHAAHTRMERDDGAARAVVNAYIYLQCKIPTMLFSSSIYFIHLLRGKLITIPI